MGETTALDLTPFVARLASELAARSGSHGVVVDGSMLSADISGFTALSERLAGKGKAGAEEITEIVNECFVALIDAAYAFEGEVIKFGGDALLVLFRGDDHELRCAHAGLAMQTALAASRAAQNAKLTMSVGAAAGPFDVVLAGSSLRELLIVGSAATEVVRLEGAAASGEVLVAPAIASRLDDALVAGERDGGILLEGVAEAEAGDVRTDRDAIDATGLIAPQIVEQLGAFADLGGEHRIVSVAFAMVTGLDDYVAEHGVDALAPALGSFVDDLLGAIEPFGATLLHTDIAPDGFKCIITAGAPVNPGDIGDAALQAGLAVAAIESPFAVRVGVQTGRVFAGFLGAPYRRTYTVMGDPVNTAARLLGQAEDGEVVATMSVVDDTRSVFDVAPLAPFRVKGKRERLHAARVHGVTDEVRRAASATRLHGRRTELEILARAFGELGETIDLVGPAGSGKSRLIDAAWDEAEGLTVFRGSCTPYGAGSPYGVFRSVLRSGTGVDQDASPEEAGRALTELVAAVAPDLQPMLPMLAVAFGADVASTPEADLVDAEFRRVRIHETVLAFLDAALDGPVLLVVEDMHWIDEASGELMTFLLRATVDRPWAAVVTRRPGGWWRPDEALTNVRTVPIRPLGPGAIRSLCIEASGRALADAEIAAIVERSQGNPLFVIELARAARATELSDLPDSVEAVVAQRIDALAPTERHLVRVAAVFGARLRVDDLAAIGEQVDVGRLAEVGLGDFLEPSGQGEVTFTHALYRDVAYSGLPYRRRRQLHARIGARIEATEGGARDRAALLSLHFSEAGDHRRAWRYSIDAGEHAIEQYATAEAAVVYERAHRAGARLRDIPARERADIATRLADACIVTGRFDTARKAIGAARRLVSSVAEDTQLMRRFGVVCERQGQLSQALSWYTRALNRIPADTAAPDELSSRAQLLLASAGIMHRRGDNHRCARVSHEALADAERAQDDSTRSMAFERLHVAHVFTRSRYAEHYGQAALAAYEARGDLNGRVKVLNNAGIDAYYAGNWPLARRRYELAVDLGEVGGVVIDGGTAALNSGEILSDQGHWRRALHMFANAQRNWQAVGYSTGIAVAELYSGVAHLRRGDLESAGVSIKIALTDLRALTASGLVDDAEARVIELDLSAGRSLSAFDGANEMLGRVDADSPLVARVRRSRALAEAQLGRVDDAVADLRDQLTVLGAGTYDRLLVLDALRALGAANDDEDSERTAICEELGVVALGAVPVGEDG